jgi:ribonuclease P protein component
LSKSDDFRATVRHGLRVGRPALVLHADRCDAQGVQVGFIVSRSVGNAVARNRVRRRLRHLAADRLASTPAGTNVVVRALPRAATMPAELPSQFADAWQAAMSRLHAREVRR